MLTRLTRLSTTVSSATKKKRYIHPPSCKKAFGRIKAVQKARPLSRLWMCDGSVSPIEPAFVYTNETPECSCVQPVGFTVRW